MSGLRALAKRTAGNLLASGVSIALGLVAGEFSVRLVAPQQLIISRPDIWQPRDTLGWEHRPNVNTTINTGEGTVRFHTDPAGFRVGAGGAVDSDTQVLLIGDSFAEALQVEYEASFAGLLESELGRALKKRVAVRDAGVGGWDPPQYLLKARQLLARDRYQVMIVALYLGNDIVPWRTDRFTPRPETDVRRFRLPRRAAWDELVDAWLAPVDAFLRTRSHLYVLAKNRTRVVRTRLGLAPVYVPTGYRRADLTSPRWSVTAQLCDEMAEAAVRSGTTAVFVLLPAPFQVDVNIMAEHLRMYGLSPDAYDLDQPNRVLGDSLRARGLTVIDVLQPLKQAQARGTPTYGRVDPHFTAAGHRVVADVLTPTLTRLLRPRQVRQVNVTDGGA